MSIASAPGTTSPDPAGDPLLAWLVARGGHVDGLAIGPTPAGRGLVATRALAPGDEPLVVPPDVLVRSEVVAATPYGLGLVAGYGPHVLLAAWLVRARRGREPGYEAYVEALPTDLSGHPLFFSLAARQALRGTAFFARLGARRRTLADEHAWVRSRLPGFDDLALDEWVEARVLATSRVYACGEGSALAPVADLLNHAAAPVASWSCDRAAGYRLRVETPVAADEEITTSYGPKSNARLLFAYGFTLPDDPHEDVELDVDGVGPVRLPADRAAPEVERLLAAVGRDVLAAACRERLALLPDPEPDDGVEPDVAHALAIRESERRVLRSWAG